MDLKDTIPGMTSDDYKERFISEYQQTAIRAAKLETLLNKVYADEAPFEPSCPRSVLEEQLLTMTRYLGILKLRARYENIDIKEVVL